MLAVGANAQASLRHQPTPRLLGTYSTMVLRRGGAESLINDAINDPRAFCIL